MCPITIDYSADDILEEWVRVSAFHSSMLTHTYRQWGSNPERFGLGDNHPNHWLDFRAPDCPLHISSIPPPFPH